MKVAFSIRWEAPIDVYCDGSFPTIDAAIKRISELPEAIRGHLEESGEIKLTITLKLKE